jgi:hypothetical protein
MDTHQVRLERRPAQRFDLQLPVSVRQTGCEQPFYGYTQNVSARGVFFYSEAPLIEGEHVELTLLMPSEVTLAEPTPMRCRCKVVRVQPPVGGTTSGIAVYLEEYEYLPQTDSVATGLETFGRVSALRRRPHAPEEVKVAAALAPPNNAALP